MKSKIMGFELLANFLGEGKGAMGLAKDSTRSPKFIEDFLVRKKQFLPGRLIVDSLKF
jgi:hypothetical protein